MNRQWSADYDLPGKLVDLIDHAIATIRVGKNVSDILESLSDELDYHWIEEIRWASGRALELSALLEANDPMVNSILPVSVCEELIEIRESIRYHNGETLID